MASFNSNLKCTCSSKTPLNSPNNLNVLLTSHSDKDFHNTNDIYDNYLDLKPNFKYYEIHDFHKITNTLEMHKQTSILHTNICSLQGNIDKLDMLVDDLDHKFDIIALSETWNPENKKHLFDPKDLIGYHTFKGTTGTTSKSGTGLYIKIDLNPLHREDLDFKTFGENEEFESTWIEIINHNNTPNT